MPETVLDRTLNGNFNSVERSAAELSGDPDKWLKQYSLSHYIADQRGGSPASIMADYDNYHKIVFDKEPLDKALTTVRDVNNVVDPNSVHSPILPEKPKEPKEPKSEFKTSIERGTASLFGSGLSGTATLLGFNEAAMEISRISNEQLKKLAPQPETTEFLTKLRKEKGLVAQLSTWQWWHTVGAESIPNLLLFLVGGGTAATTAKLALRSKLLINAATKVSPKLPGLLVKGEKILTTAASATVAGGTEVTIEGGSAVGQLQHFREEGEQALEFLNGLDEPRRTEALSSGLYKSIEVYEAMVKAGSNPETAGKVASEVMRKDALVSFASNFISIGGGRLAASAFFNKDTKKRLGKMILGFVAGAAEEPETEIRQDENLNASVKKAIDQALTREAIEVSIFNDLLPSRLYRAWISDDQEQLNTALTAFVIGFKSPVMGLMSEVAESNSIGQAEAKMKKGVEALRNLPPELAAGVDLKLYIDRYDKAKTFKEKFGIWQEAAREVNEKNFDLVNKKREEEEILKEERALFEEDTQIEKDVADLLRKEEGLDFLFSFDPTDLDELESDILGMGGIKDTRNEELINIPKKFKNKNGVSVEDALARAVEIGILPTDAKAGDLVNLLNQPKAFAPKLKEQLIDKIPIGTAIDFEDGTRAIVIGIDDNGNFLLDVNGELVTQDKGTKIKGQFNKATQDEVENIIAEHGDLSEIDPGTFGDTIDVQTNEILGELGLVFNESNDFSAFSFDPDKTQAINQQDLKDFSTQDKGSSRPTVEDVSARVKALDFESERVVVVQKAEDLPVEIFFKMKRDFKDKLSNVNGFFFFGDGKVYLIADNINPKNIDQVISHEVAGHLGLRELFGQEKLDKTLQQVFRSLPKDLLEATAKKYKLTDAVNLGLENAQNLNAEEVLAKLAEDKNPDPTLVQKIYAAIRQLLRDAGFKNFQEFTDNDIKVLLARAQTAAKKATGKRTANKESGARFSKAPPTESAAFKKWFGDSKIVDEDGEPLVVFHGTNSDFTEFNKKKFGNRDSGLFGEGFYFTATKSIAESFGHKTVPVYLALKNPFKWPLDRRHVTTVEESRKITEELKAQGFDGITVAADKEGQRPFMEVIAFEPNQIKSATDNVGTFDATNPDIRFSRKDQIEIEKDVRIDLAGRIFKGEKVLTDKARIALIKAGADPNRAADILSGANIIASRLQERSKEIPDLGKLRLNIEKELSDREKRGFAAGEFTERARARIKERKTLKETKAKIEGINESFNQKLKDTKRTLNDLFDKHINDSVTLEREARKWMVEEGFAQEDRGRLIAPIINIGAVKSAKVKQARLEEFKIKAMDFKLQRDKKRNLDKIDILFKKALATKKTKRGEIKGGNLLDLDEDIKRLFNLKEMSLADFDITVLALSDQIEKARDQDDFDKAQESELELMDLVTFGALKEREPQNVEDALFILESFIKEKKLAYREFIAERKARWDLQRSEIVQALGAVDEFEAQQKKLDKNKRPLSKKISETLNDFTSRHLSLEQKLDKLADLDPSGVMEAIVADWKEFFWKGNQKEQSENRRTHDKLGDEIARIWGIKEDKTSRTAETFGFTTRKTDDILLQMSQEEVKISKAHKEEGQPRQFLNMNQDRALYLWLAMSQPQLEANMLSNGWDSQSMKDLTNSLPKEVLELGRFMQKNLDNEYDILNAVYRQLFAANMPRNLQYFPFRPDVESRSKENVEEFTQGLADMNTMMNPTALIARVQHGIKVDLSTGATTMFLTHKLQMSRFKAYATGGKDFFAVMGNKDVARSVKNTFGDEFYKILMQHSAETVSGGNRAFARDPLPGKLKGFFVLKNLAGNVGVFFKQLVSVPAYYNNMTARQFFATLATSWTPAALADYKMLINTEFIQNRWTSGNHIEALFILDRAQKRGFLGRLGRAGMLGTRLGDLAPILVMGRGVYNQALNEAKRKGLSDVKAAEHAEFVMGAMTEQSQQSSAWKDRTSFQRSGTWGEVASMFQTSPRQYFALGVRAVQRAKGRGTTKEIAKAVEVGVIVFGVLPASFLFVGNVFKYNILGREDDRDEEEILREYAAIMLNSPFAGMYLIRYITEEFINKVVTGKHQYFSADIPITSIDKDIINMFEIAENLVLTAKGDKTVADVAKELGQLLPAFKQASDFTQNRIKK